MGDTDNFVIPKPVVGEVIYLVIALALSNYPWLLFGFALTISALILAITCGYVKTARRYNSLVLVPPLAVSLLLLAGHYQELTRNVPWGLLILFLLIICNAAYFYLRTTLPAQEEQ